MATVIASQATISGAFSVTQQAIALGFLPRMRIHHTSESEMEQVYIPLANLLQTAAVVLAVVGFGSSSNLASAYGIAATATMLMTTLLTFFVIRHGWKYSLLLIFAATGFFLIIDITLFSSTSLKIISGGWFPLVISAFMVTLMLTWRKGSELVFENIKHNSIPVEDFLPSLFADPPHRVEGTAIYFRPDGDGVPSALMHNLLHTKVLHKRVIFMTVFTTDIHFLYVPNGLEPNPINHLSCVHTRIYKGRVVAYSTSMYTHSN